MSNETDKLFKVLERDWRCNQELENWTTQRDKEALAKCRHPIRRHSRMRDKFDGWKTFQDGITRRFDGVGCRVQASWRNPIQSLHTAVWQRESVDVKLATDLLELRNIYDIGVIVSGDQDYVPAVQAAKDHGKKIVNVAFETRGNQLLPGGARRLNQMTDSTVEVDYETLRNLMRF